MVKVVRYGDTITVKNPARPGEETVLIIVTFQEEGRQGANHGISGTSEFLSSLLGEEVGLNNVRTHSQPIIASKIGLFPIGKEINGFINRILTSTPQINAQVPTAPRMVDGRPTYFQTVLEDVPKDDVDQRLSNDILAASNPELFFGAKVGTAQVSRKPTEKVVEDQPLEQVNAGAGTLADQG